MKRKVAVVTGTRAEYGVLYPVLKAIEQHPKLQLLLVATGMHLSREFGYTVEELEKDGFRVDAKVDMLLSDDTSSAMSKSVGIGIIGLTQTWEQLEPEVIVVLGDRVEPLAAAISGAYMNIPIAHIHGGDASKGGLDESARHAITKFAHIHFPATKQSAQRIVKMGEDRWRVHTVGSPALDTILNEPLLSAKTVARKLGLDLSRPVILVLQHPVTTQVENAAEQMRQTLQAIVGLQYPAVVIYPNSDAGGRRMIEAIKQYEGIKQTDDKWDSFWLAQMKHLNILPEGYIYPKEERPIRDMLRRRLFFVNHRTANILSLQSMVSRNLGTRISVNAIKRLNPDDAGDLFD